MATARRDRWRWVTAAMTVAGCASTATPPAMDDAALARARHQMVERDIRGRGVRDERVLAAMNLVPRHRFVPASLQAEAYGDFPLSIGEGQTISQPYVVALMTEQLALSGGERVLEIGTGSGYQSAVLAAIGCEVYSIEISPGLAASAQERLAALGYGKVQVRVGDGFFGWPEAAPFDAIIIAAATPVVPQPLVDQLREGGRIVLPLGPEATQELMAGSKGPTGVRLESVGGVRFVPMTGKAQQRP